MHAHTHMHTMYHIHMHTMQHTHTHTQTLIFHVKTELLREILIHLRARGYVAACRIGF